MNVKSDLAVRQALLYAYEDWRVGYCRNNYESHVIMGPYRHGAELGGPLCESGPLSVSRKILALLLSPEI